jgi:hypothetical protein
MKKPVRRSVLLLLAAAHPFDTVDHPAAACAEYQQQATWRLRQQPSKPDIVFCSAHAARLLFYFQRFLCLKT